MNGLGRAMDVCFGSSGGSKFDYAEETGSSKIESSSKVGGTFPNLVRNLGFVGEFWRFEFCKKK